MGLIPKGWRCTQFGELTTRITTKVKDKMYPVLSAIKVGDLVLSEEYFIKKVFSDDISRYITVEPNDFAYNPARINIGSIGINSYEYAGCVSPVYIVFRVDSGYHNYFNFFIKSQRFRDETEMRSSGSVRQNMSYDDISQIAVIYPPRNIVDQFNSIMEQEMRQTKHYRREIMILLEIRDTLLPKLMSGEIEVPVEG